MGYKVWEPGTFRYDPGTMERLYPIEEAHDETVILYDREIQRTSQNMAEIVGIFYDWFLGFFPPNYFKYTRVRTQVPYAEFKSTMKNIYHKDKPLCIIDPQQTDIVEDSLFYQNMLNRYNMMESSDDIGAKLLYSIQIMKDDTFELVYRRNRFRFEMNAMIMEQTMDRQLNTYNALVMNIRHNSKFLLPRTVPQMIPIRYIENIARLHHFSDVMSDEFLRYLNTISRYTIHRRITTRNQPMFFMNVEMNIQVESNGMPSKDTPEMSQAIEWGARIVDSFVFICDLPAEFLFMIPMESRTKMDRSIRQDPDAISFVSPYFTDMTEWPDQIGDYTCITQADIQMQEGDDNTMDVICMVGAYDEKAEQDVREFIARGGPLEDLIKVRVYPNGSLVELGTTLKQDGTLVLHNAKVEKLYTARLFLNQQTLNLIREGKYRKYIGTIETTKDY